MRSTIYRPRSRDHIHVAVSGQFSLDDVDQMFSEITTVHDWRPGMSLLFDVAWLDTDDIYSMDLEEVAATVAGLRGHFEHSKIAILVRSDLQFALAKQFQSLTEKRTSTRIGVFRNEELAKEWLRSDD